jgi:polar amino acid transport system substrate-binding protein
MQQLTQNLKNGDMKLLEAPFPALQAGQVLVRNHYSLISAGTEGRTVKDARAGWIAKARARKAEVAKVIRSVKTLGLSDTYRMVMNRLEAPQALGYCCAGTVIAVSDDVTSFRIGDRVACGGSGAVHAEIVAVPAMLCALIPDQVSFQDAAFTTLGAIAMQGVRQAGLQVGEHCAVIGLGLIGQLTLSILEASGISCIGIDTDPAQVELARKNGHKHVYLRDESRLQLIVEKHTDGHGCDAVIITASSSSTDPINLAGELCRIKGKVIIVGSVPTGFERKPFYEKELDLKMSMSYGPGRYDTEYEEHGIDYPYPYVRWTENRNMTAFVALIAAGKLHLRELQTHEFPFQKAPDAYRLILERNEPFAGILLAYSVSSQLRDKIILSNPFQQGQAVRVGMIGAGSFAQNFLLPGIRNKASLIGLSTNRPNMAQHVAEKFGFTYCSGDAQSLIRDQDINTIVIATRHDSHAHYVTEALKAGKHVFTEKPLCLHPEELEHIREAYREAGTQLMIGFNRRFSPAVRLLMEHINPEIPLAINYRINAGKVDANHWIHDPKIGGGRIIGEACHFIDLCAFLSGSRISHVSAVAMPANGIQSDTVCISLRMQNGSIANISYFSNGNSNVSKEQLEVFNGGFIGRIDDFVKVFIHSQKKTLKRNTGSDKGHAACISSFIHSIESGKPSPIGFDAVYNSTRATFMVLESIAKQGELIPLASNESE